MSGHTCPQCHEDFPSTSCALNGSIGHDCRPPQLIDPDDIRVGDTVECAIVHRFDVTRVGRDVIESGVGLYQKLESGRNQVVAVRWELVSRPQPQPEVGQHWLDSDGDEWVCVMRSGGQAFAALGPNKSIRYADFGAPTGWTLKP